MSLLDRVKKLKTPFDVPPDAPPPLPVEVPPDLPPPLPPPLTVAPDLDLGFTPDHFSTLATSDLDLMFSQNREQWPARSLAQQQRNLQTLFAKRKWPCKVYLAGPISGTEWRGAVVNVDGLIDRDESPYSDILCNNLVQGADIPWPELPISAEFVLVGPYFVDCGKCCHGGNLSPHGYSRITKRCLEAIRKADLIFAWLTPDAFGTIAELGYAAALKKPIVVASTPSPYNEKDELAFVRALSTVSLEYFELDGKPTSFHSAETALDVFMREAQSARAREVDQAEKERWLTGEATSESPVEKLLFQAFVRQAVKDNASVKGAPVGWDDGVFGIYGENFSVRPQYELPELRYRLDFALFTCGLKIAVEVDGHDFHERTKEQAQRDKKRDRDLQVAGWRVLRFTGSEVYRNADVCVADAFRMVGH